jgi:hypothetical protein
MWQNNVKSALGLAALAVLALGSADLESPETAAIQRADEEFNSGNRSAAISVYKENFRCARGGPRVCERIVEYEMEQGNDVEAQMWIEKAIDTGYWFRPKNEAVAKLFSKALKRIEERGREQEQHEKQRLEEAERTLNKRIGDAIQAPDLFSQFENNAIAADRVYKDRCIDVIGRVQEVDRDMLGNPYVALEADIVGVVQCFFRENQAGELAKLSKGQAVVIAGTCRGKFLISVTLKNCELLR